MALPAAYFYASTKGIEAYYRLEAIIVASLYTLEKPEVQAARSAGAKVLLYLNPAEIALKTPDPELTAFYYEATLWPYAGTQGARSNSPGTVLADIRASSPWTHAVLDRAQDCLVGWFPCDGLYLDVVGSRLWSPSSEWNLWPPYQQDAWAAGCADLVRRVDAARRSLNPQFLLVNNNFWTDPTAEAAVDGVNIEHHPPTAGSATWNYASRSFANLGHRCVIATCLTAADALAWATCPGITHVAAQPDYVSGAPAPVV